MTLVPFYRVFFERYALYWPVMDAAAYAKYKNNLDAEALAAQRLEARTVDHVRIGEADSETAHNLVADSSHTGRGGEPFTHWRDATGSFSYTVKTLPDQPLSLQAAYWGSDAGRTFDILVDGQTVGTQTLNGEKPNAYLYVTYPIPAALTQGKTSVTVKFVPKADSTAGGLFDLRVLRSEETRFLLTL